MFLVCQGTRVMTQMPSRLPTESNYVNSYGGVKVLFMSSWLKIKPEHANRGFVLATYAKHAAALNRKTLLRCICHVLPSRLKAAALSSFWLNGKNNCPSATPIIHPQRKPQLILYDSYQGRRQEYSTTVSRTMH